MRAFENEGRSWTARVYDGPKREGTAGWEVIVFDEETGSRQKITFRPAGWLSEASAVELIRALEEGESVRTRWQAG